MFHIHKKKQQVAHNTFLWLNLCNLTRKRARQKISPNENVVPHCSPAVNVTFNKRDCVKLCRCLTQNLYPVKWFVNKWHDENIPSHVNSRTHITEQLYEQKPRNTIANYILCSIILCTYRFVP